MQTEIETDDLSVEEQHRQAQQSGEVFEGEPGRELTLLERMDQAFERSKQKGLIADVVTDHTQTEELWDFDEYCELTDVSCETIWRLSYV